MPMFTFKVTDSNGACDERQLGLYRAEAAIDYARRLSRDAHVEIWADGDIVAALEDGAELASMAESST